MAALGLTLRQTPAQMPLPILIFFDCDRKRNIVADVIVDMTPHSKLNLILILYRSHTDAHFRLRLLTDWDANNSVFHGGVPSFRPHAAQGVSLLSRQIGQTFLATKMCRVSVPTWSRK